MFKFVCELTVFVFVLMQIAILTSYTKKGDGDHPAALQQSTGTSTTLNAGEIAALYADPENPPNAYVVAEHVNAPDILQELARQEAQKIVRTGDVSELTAQIEKNRPLLRIFGYNL